MLPAAPLAAYLRLRLRLLARLLCEIGWWRLVLGGAMLGLGLLQALASLGGHPVGRWLLPLLGAGALLGAHRQRADLPFLASAAPGFRPWLAVEYGLAALPGALGLLAVRGYGPAALLLGLAPLVAWAPPARADAATRHRWRSPFRSEAFEWVGGMRATKGLWLWPILVALATWQRAQPLAPVAGLLLWLLVVAACYGIPEPSPMLTLAARTPRQFLRRRLALGLGYAAATAAPFWLLLGLGSAGGGAVLAVALFWLWLLSMVILCKYAFYPVVGHIRSTQGLVLAVGLLGAWHPAYPPVMLAAAGGLVWQSQRRLRAVLAT
ncbi:hypothetical protein GCM10023172_13100 [Hymenobacter ginsengisoli]|uniref:ABC transporter permease n=1 Tax=Hymenobacter ginsengisoli TaxID=1051626 RepID=A0ABP8Q4B5_9BACT|nr:MULTISPECIES: hypothetical protein [unclassified Hymenobacter]MBO2031897.1 hypothetical protein [Hymenobacter sp. BT559]